MSKKYTKDQIEEMIGALQEQLVEIKYTEKNNQKIDNKTKIICNICGGSYDKSNISHHRKTKKHRLEIEHMRQLERLVKSKKMEGR